MTSLSAMQFFDRFPIRYIAPNAVTCVGLVMGLASIRTSLTATGREDYLTAAWLILYAVLLDKLDGTVARRLKASSEIGVQLDSFSDFVTFGIAPAALISHYVPWAVPQPWGSGVAHGLALAGGALYAIAAALRLAKFNVTTAAIGPRFFLGLPSTSSGGILASGLLAHHELGLGLPLLQVFLGLLVVNAVMMVSNVPQPKLHLSSNKLLRAAQILIVLSVYVLVPLHRFPTYIVSVALVYTIGGFIYGLSAGPKELLAPAEDDDETDAPQPASPSP